MLKRKKWCQHIHPPANQTNVPILQAFPRITNFSQFLFFIPPTMIYPIFTLQTRLQNKKKIIRHANILLHFEDTVDDDDQWKQTNICHQICQVPWFLAFFDLFFSCIFFFFASAVTHVYSVGMANGSCIFSILLLEPPLAEPDRWYGALIHPNQDELVEDWFMPGLSRPAPLGLEGGVENSSNGCSSSNFVNVTSTLMVGITGIATWKKHRQVF